MKWPVRDEAQLDLSVAQARARALDYAEVPLEELRSVAVGLAREGHGNLLTYSRKVFIPFTELCRDVCHYCTFAKAPRAVSSPYWSEERVLDVARAGVAAGCKEVLFTLGERPEARYRVARQALKAAGHASTIDYVIAMAERVVEETGLLPHVNAGTLTARQLRRLRAIAPSVGMMLESASERLRERGMPHHGSPDKAPARRLATLRAAGRERVPFTTGLLIGIGETRQERIDALLALYRLQLEYGHIQELILQNFRAKPGTRMANAREPSLAELLWTIGIARVIFGPSMSLQAPPNLTDPDELEHLLGSGINDVGGISPVTPDYVNPEAPWPHLDRLAARAASCGLQLQERLTVYPSYVASPWLHGTLLPKVLRHADTARLGREDDWVSGESTEVPRWAQVGPLLYGPRDRRLDDLLARLRDGDTPGEEAFAPLFTARGNDYFRLCEAADVRRHELVGDEVTFVENCNINYTNICTYQCSFCAFSKGSHRKGSRDAPYLLDVDAIVARGLEAQAAGATELCLQGGIHPSFSGDTYLGIVRALREALPTMHLHAFSPLEIFHGARTLGWTLAHFLETLRDAGLSTLPGTAAEILSDDVRSIICPDKLSAEEWCDVVSTAHAVGLPTTATMMFGHVDDYRHWARHLLRIYELQAETGGLTEFVPLPFVAAEAPMYRRGVSRRGPSFREAVLVHAVARLLFGASLPNIQVSWVKMGFDGAAAALRAGCNDLGGTLMKESITRAAGARHGLATDRAELLATAARAGRPLVQRGTLYQRLASVGGEPIPLTQLS